MIGPNNAIVDGYMSDGDALGINPGNQLGQNSQKSPPHSNSSVDDGYLSEGGASFYARKIQTRIALEKQKTAEEQRKKLDEVYDKATRRPLPGLPDVLSGGNSDKMQMPTGAGSGGQIYRVVGGRKHVQKSEAGMQTEAGAGLKQSVQDHYDWKEVIPSFANRV